MFIEVKSENEMKDLGAKIGTLLKGGEIIELIGDVGSGKTTLTKGLAVGLEIDEYVQSPSFSINRTYVGRDNLILSHYDFYRLNDAGIMANELAETMGDDSIITVIEWGGVVDDVLPDDRLSITIVSPTETARELTIKTGGPNSQRLVSEVGL